MIYNDVVFGSFAPSEIELNLNELYARLGIKEINEDVCASIEKIKTSADFRFAHTVTDLSICGDYASFDSVKVRSTSLSYLLSSSSKAIFMAVTLGNEVDRLITRTFITNKKEAFYLDAVSSAYAESLADHLNVKLAEKYNLTHRFSPGYADFPLEFQSSLLERLNAGESVGILTTEKHLMIPQKSISAVMGIISERRRLIGYS